MVDVNGIKIGMVCYTWAYSSNGSSFSLNGLTPIKDEGQMNYFLNNDPGKLYTASEQILEQMKADGAEATMMFIHWGVEYNIKENSLQDTMAQKLCDLGFDVIVGGHPHVVQPVDLLTSTVDPDHKTVVIYSLGNAVSNQRLGLLKSISTAHTEDGVLFSITFSKYTDGTVYLEDVNLIPTWVRAIDANGNTVVRSSATIRRYEILPLEDARRSQWQELFGIDESTLTQCADSWQRTMDITSAGLSQAKNYLQAEKIAREANYQWIAEHAA